MENDIKELIQTFREYRDLLTPIEQSLRAFSSSFDGIMGDLKNLNGGLSGDIQGKLDKIYKEISLNAEKSKTLTGDIDRFATQTQKYVSSVDRLLSVCEKIENKIDAINAIEEKAETQIGRLDDLIEEKKKTYDIKGLEKKLEAYNVGVQKVSEYINTGVSDALQSSGEKISEIKDNSSEILRAIEKENESIERLAKSYESSTKVLKNLIEKESVNEEYIFEILDRWAEDRRVKTRK